LAAYLGSEAVIRFGNLDTALTELEAILSSIEKSDPESGQDGSSWPEDRSYRFCTGEFTDSLIYEEGLGISASLIELFRSSTKCYLELKTKTADLGSLLKLDHGGRTVISFSLNAPFIAQNHEPKAAPLIKRLQAAQAAAAAGYPLGFHFDPIVHYKDWRSGYGQTIELLDQYVPWDRIAWISLGCFRYLGPLKNAQLAKNPSSLFDAEFIRALDGKFRYPRPLRRLLYEGLLDLLKPRLDPRTTVYFCMESPRMWRDLLGFDPQTSQLTARFRKPFLTEPWTMRSSADPDFQP
jgi:spore photoproduct lyase